MSARRSGFRHCVWKSEFIVSFRQGLVTPGWNDVFHTGNYRVKRCFGHYMLLCQAKNVLLGIELLGGHLE